MGASEHIRRRKQAEEARIKAELEAKELEKASKKKTKKEKGE